MNLPKSLIPFDKKLRFLPPETALFFFKNHFDNSLYVYKSRLEFTGGYINILGDRMQNLGWFVKEYYKREDNLWGIFSEELIKKRLTDKKGIIYEVHCDQAFSCTAIGIPDEAYILTLKNKEELKNAFLFGADKLLRKASSVGFLEENIKSLADFFYEDFTTMKYTEESRQTGQDADSVFFP